MILNIQLAIKFRAFFTDIYKMDQTFRLTIPAPPVPFTLNQTLFHDKGVFLKVWI